MLRQSPARPHSLTIEEIEEVTKLFKERLTGDCERLVRRKDMEGALAAIAAKEYIDQFVYELKMLAAAPWRQQRDMPPKARPIRVAGKKSA